jgi:probable phosphoglycerate mutase
MKRLIIHFLIITSLISLMISCGGDKSPSHQDQNLEGEDFFTIYLVRHAQAYKNISPLPNLPPEKLDSLTPEGEKQADALGNYLIGRSITKIYTSPTGRTKQTAERISTILGKRNLVAADTSFVSLKKGKTTEGKKITWSWRVEQWDKGMDPRPIGGESMADGQKRAVNKLRQLHRQIPDSTIIVVTHGDIAAALLAYANGSAITSAYKQNAVETGSLSEIVVSGGKWKSIRSNYIPGNE